MLAATATTSSSDTHFFTFWDMDDTSIALSSASIKNPHLLLPIMLFQTYAQNQHFGIMTNRGPDDNVYPYTVTMYQEDLRDFGISLCDEYIVFGGGEKGRALQFAHQNALLAIDTLQAQLESLTLAEDEDVLAQQLKQLQLISQTLEEKKYSGKNNCILEFINGRYHQGLRQYQLVKGICDKKNLVVGIVDDLDNIAQATANLGTGFFGVQASRGGNPPKGNALDDNFYSVDYLHELAQKIGFEAYSERFINDPKSHRHDHPMLQMAALLYQWQLQKAKDGLFEKVIKRMNPEQCYQIQEMLDYIMHVNAYHEQAGYRPLDAIFQCLNARTHSVFLNQCLAKMTVLDDRINRILKTNAVDTQESETPKTKGSGILKRLGSKRQNSTPVASYQPTEDEKSLLNILTNKKRRLIERLALLTSFTELAISIKATELYEVIVLKAQPRKSANVSSSSSSRSSGDEVKLKHKRRSFTPGYDDALETSASTSAGPLRVVSTGELLELEKYGKKEKDKDKSKKM
ncbi:MAG: hypothetical protein AB7V32_06790 [Candidatus Berkiella sp.]